MISGASKIQRVVALSTVEAEFMAGTEACKELIWILSICTGFGMPFTLPTTLYGNNTASIALARNPEFHQRTKHIAIRERFISFLVDKQIVTVVYMPTSNMLADSFTKPLPKDRHHSHAERSGIDLQIIYTCANCWAEFSKKSDLDTHSRQNDHGQIYKIDEKKRKREHDEIMSGRILKAYNGTIPTDLHNDARISDDDYGSNNKKRISEKTS